MEPTPSLVGSASQFISTNNITNIIPTASGLTICDNRYFNVSSTPTLYNNSLTEMSNQNCSLNSDVREDDLLLWNLMTTVFYGVIIIVGVVGNFLVIGTLARWSDMRSPCNFLLANIAAADFGVAIFLTPVRILELYVGWPLGKWGCHILFPLQDVFVSVSVVTHTAIALERHRAITWPFKLKLSRKKVKQITLGIWLGCYTLTGLPQSAFSRFMVWRGRSYCWPEWPEWPTTSDDFRVGYELLLVSVFIVAPLLIQTFAYIRVIRIMKLKDELHRIHSRCDSFETSSSMKHSHSQYRRRVRKKRKLVRMLIVLLISFQICYIPRGVAMLLYEFVPSLEHSGAFNNIDKAIMILYYTKHVVNPVVLWFMSQDFHSGFLAITTCRQIHRGQSVLL